MKAVTARAIIMGIVIGLFSSLVFEIFRDFYYRGHCPPEIRWLYGLVQDVDGKAAEFTV